MKNDYGDSDYETQGNAEPPIGKPRELITTLGTSLNCTQRNAINTKELSQQISALSGEELHKEIIKAILADPSASLSEKISFVDHENDAQEVRKMQAANTVMALQTQQTENTDRATSDWGNTVAIVFFSGIGVALLAGTSTGRAVLNDMIKQLKTLW